MEDEKQKQEAGIPENAFRELKPGEEYIPVMRPDRQYPEVTPYSVIMGLVMAIIFSAAAAYLGLKVGQVFEAAIPIAIIAVGVSGALKKKNALGQNVIIQSIGASSGIVVAGAIFTLPALYILQAKYGDAITVSFIEIFLSSMLGGVLGVLMFIPFRKYFVSDMHGKFPFPEATATTQVLISGEKSGSQVKPLIIAGAVGGIYDFLLSTFGWWAETLTSKATEFGAHVASQAKMVFKINTGAAVLGLGYIVGLKYCFIIFAGSAFIWYVIVPLLGMSPEAAAIDPEVLFKTQARYIGIGGIAMSGIIGIIKSWGIIRSAVGLAGREFRGKGGNVAKVKRTQKDISMKVLAFSLIAALAVTFAFFYFGVIHNLFQTLVAFLVVTVIAFLFTTVAANAIAIVGSNPVSGMTLMTLIVASAVFVAIGLKGASGIVTSMIIGGVVCTALSLAWLHSAKTAAVETGRHTRVGSNCRRRYPDSCKSVWFLRAERTRRTAGQRDGRRYRTVDDGWRHAVATLWRRRNPRRASQLARCAGIGFLARYVYPYGAQRAAACRRFGQLVCVNPFERQGTQCGTHRARHASRQRIYRRWSIDGRGQRRNALRRLRVYLRIQRVDAPDRRCGCLCAAHRLSRLGLYARKESVSGGNLLSLKNQRKMSWMHHVCPRHIIYSFYLSTN